MDNDTVSIIIPIYNAELYIDKLVESIKNQTYNKLEIIMISDGSTDSSYEILKKITKSDRRFKVYKQNNCGQAITRNNGILMATGYYITFIDQDDYMDDNYIEKLTSSIGDNDLILSGYKRVNSTKVIKNNIPSICSWSFYKYGATWGKIYKSSFIKENDLKFENFAGEDIYFFMHAIAITNKKKVISYAGYNNYQNTESITHQINNKKNTRSKMDKLLNKIESSSWVNNLDQNELLYFYMKTIVLHLFTQRNLLNNKELYNEYKYYFDWLVSKYQKRNKKISFAHMYGEERYITMAVNAFVFAYKFKMVRPLLAILKISNNKNLK